MPGPAVVAERRRLRHKMISIRPVPLLTWPAPTPHRIVRSALALQLVCRVLHPAAAASAIDPRAGGRRGPARNRVVSEWVCYPAFGREHLPVCSWCRSRAVTADRTGEAERGRRGYGGGVLPRETASTSARAARGRASGRGGGVVRAAGVVAGQLSPSRPGLTNWIAFGASSTCRPRGQNCSRATTSIRATKLSEGDEVQGRTSSTAMPAAGLARSRAASGLLFESCRADALLWKRRAGAHPRERGVRKVRPRRRSCLEVMLIRIDGSRPRAGLATLTFVRGLPLLM